MEKYNMRSPREKEKILKEYYSGKIGRNEISRKYHISTQTLRKWRMKYEELGIKGLKSQTGTKKGGTKGQGNRKPNDRTEELELELMKICAKNGGTSWGLIVIYYVLLIFIS